MVTNEMVFQEVVISINKFNNVDRYGSHTSK